MTTKATDVKNLKNVVQLELSEVILLNHELQGLQSEPTISFAVKYELVKLLERTQDIVRRFNKQKLELFKKYGKCTDEKTQTYTLQGADKEKEGLKELDLLISTKETFNESFEMEDFKDMKSAIPYIQIMKFIK